MRDLFHTTAGGLIESIEAVCRQREVDRRHVPVLVDEPTQGANLMYARWSDEEQAIVICSVRQELQIYADNPDAD